MHFLVIVVGDDVDEQLAPFQEGGLDTCPEQYLEFHDEEDVYRERYLTGVFDCPLAKVEYPEHFGKPIREVFPTFDDYMDEVYGPRDERTRRYGEWWNPNSEYDWYEVGGRFTGHLILKPGREASPGNPDAVDVDARPERADQARKGDIDFGAMSRESYQSCLAVWERLERAGKTADRWAKTDYGIPESIATREQLIAYARRRSIHNAPVAVVSGGEWFGPGRGNDDLTEEEAEKWDLWYGSLLETLPEDTLLTVIDCHV